jgi:phosphoglucomutase
MDILEKARLWLGAEYDEETRNKVRMLLETDEKELSDSFYTQLEFGTGGLRGIMGVGTNRMNIYTVMMATQGLASYINQQFSPVTSRVAIAYDSRNNSALFAQKAAEVLAANGVDVFLFSSLRPTPLLSFAVRYLHCQSGIVVTASHNPKEYNGYKVYWEDGGQILPPHDKNIIWEVEKIKGLSDVKTKFDPVRINHISIEVEKAYLEMVKSLSLSPAAVEKQSQLKIVYTPLHGTGISLLPQCLENYGFKNIHIVREQAIPDGNFPTVHSPNPEEKAAMEMAMKQADQLGADLVLATDPDSDRVGIAIRNEQGILELLNGNQTAVLLVNYLIQKNKENGTLKSNHFIGKTIVTTYMLDRMAEENGLKIYNVLTGFKYIAELIRNLEGKEIFLGGGEESYGYLAGDFVRDKDAILSATLIAEMCAWSADKGQSLYAMLKELYIAYGFFKESLVSVTKKGQSGVEEIAELMERFRTNPPQRLGGSKVIKIKDFKTQRILDPLRNPIGHTLLPKSNVLQFVLEDDSLITVRPSGTEPKIKYYFSVNERQVNQTNFASVDKLLNDRLAILETEMKSY